ncbi:MAG: hypothetical protein GXX85_16555 [Ignavibacteria bacterium]|nr:hypothetical protein [Ignavibacteria bacterium]
MSNNILNLSVEAISFIEHLYHTYSLSNEYRLRITAHGALGAIIEYEFGFDSKNNSDDTIIPFSNFDLIIDSETLHNMEGSFLNFSGTFEAGEFIVDNPYKNLINHDKCNHNH